jgi:hypothetical protein
MIESLAFVSFKQIWVQIASKGAMEGTQSEKKAKEPRINGSQN